MSRRNFIKGLGLAGAGLGAAAATTPVFHDVDELMSSPNGTFKYNWWVKEREAYNPTIEVDWGLLKPWTRGPTNPKSTPWYLEKRVENSIITDAYSAAGKNKWDRKWSALRSGAADRLGDSPSPFTELTSSEKYTGTPEENANVVRAALSYLGSPEVHFLKINDRTRKLYRLGRSTEDLATGNCSSIIVSLIRKDLVISRRGGGDPFGYSNRSVIRNRMVTFMTKLGYNCVSLPINSNSAFGVLSGAAELGRTDHAVSHTYGTALKVFNVYATNLALPEDNPIDAGITKFCYTCKRCAEQCDIQGCHALSLETEPTWELPSRLPAADGKTSEYKIIGVKKWFCDYAYCRCIASCWQNCTFNQLNKAFAHTIIRATIPNTTIFNGFFASMDRVFDYGSTVKSNTDHQHISDGIEAWWNRDLSSWTHDVVPSGDNVH